eukprot:CAMPEP_0171291212 /NCGR_PEP_ID=MMETSP0790-20130122/71538_1 /TAXON_ID=2925 /ORGANISM="Alexandrium catenella, Strain OF101" /LENGTH=744 /DNA_ID=CAMNT_0011760933 /DNA_START=51 /DNA_END=2285 /DNA_ORIENTATION=-
MILRCTALVTPGDEQRLADGVAKVAKEEAPPEGPSPKDAIDSWISVIGDGKHYLDNPSVEATGKFLTDLGGTMAMLLPPPVSGVIGGALSIFGAVFSIFGPKPIPPEDRAVQMLKELRKTMEEHFARIETSILNMQRTMEEMEQYLRVLYIDGPLGGEKRRQVDSRRKTCDEMARNAANEDPENRQLKWEETKDCYQGGAIMAMDYMQETNNAYTKSILVQLLQECLKNRVGSPWQAALVYRNFIVGRFNAWHLATQNELYSFPKPTLATANFTEALVVAMKQYEAALKQGEGATFTDNHALSDQYYSGALREDQTLQYNLTDLVVSFTQRKLAECIGLDAQLRLDLKNFKDSPCIARSAHDIRSGEVLRKMSEQCGAAGSKLAWAVNRSDLLAWPHFPNAVELYFQSGDRVYSVSDCMPGKFRPVSKQLWTLQGQAKVYPQGWTPYPQLLTNTDSEGSANAMTWGSLVANYDKKGDWGLYRVDWGHRTEKRPWGWVVEGSHMPHDLPWLTEHRLSPMVVGDLRGGAFTATFAAEGRFHHISQTNRLHEWKLPPHSLIGMAPDGCGGVYLICISEVNGILYRATPDLPAYRIADLGHHLSLRQMEYDGKNGVYILCEDGLKQYNPLSATPPAPGVPTAFGSFTDAKFQSSAHPVVRIFRVGLGRQQLYGIDTVGVMVDLSIDPPSPGTRSTKLGVNFVSKGWEACRYPTFAHRDNNDGAFIWCRESLWHVSQQHLSGLQWQLEE